MSEGKSYLIPILKQIAIPISAYILFYIHHHNSSTLSTILSIVSLLAAVFSAVHHAEIISKRIGEPFGSLVLAIAITIIESAIIISMMLTNTEGVEVLARDTVFASIMIILTGMVGITLLIGGIKYHEPSFSSFGVNSLLTIITAISVLTLILPNFTISVPGPFYSSKQLIFVTIISLILYASFIFIQNFKHVSHFLSDEIEEELEKPSKLSARVSLVILPLNLLAVVLLAEGLAPNLEELILHLGAPISISGIIIACVVLLPEGIASINAAKKNQLQKSLNLSLGSALASISLTIPVVASFSVLTNTPIALGISSEYMILFLLSLFIIVLALSKGKTTVLQGIVLIILFIVYLFLTIYP